MKNTSIFSFLFLSFTVCSAQNSLLQDPTTGNLAGLTATDGIELVSNGTDVVLVASNSGANALYAIDLEDNNPAEAEANTVTEISNFEALIGGAIGSTNISIEDIQVNPISKAVYVFATSGGNSYIVKVAENGASTSLIDNSSLTYSQINNSDYELQDMSFGENTLFITSGSWTLDGAIAKIEAPFTHNSNTTNRATTMFKTNWGGNYFTTAPLERFDHATINGEGRLLGVTVCAPGFSLKTDQLAGTGVLEVYEQFNVNQMPPKKVVHQNQTDGHYLFDLHSGNTLIRIGESYLDGSPFNSGDYNNSAQLLRDFGGAVTTGLTEEQVKIYPNSYEMIAFWSNYHLLVLENDVLKLLTTGTAPIGIEENENLSVSVSPNPTTQILELNFQESYSDLTILIYDLQGKQLLSFKGQNSTTQQVDLGDLARGNYLLQIQNGTTVIHKQQISKK